MSPTGALHVNFAAINLCPRIEWHVKTFFVLRTAFKGMETIFFTFDIWLNFFLCSSFRWTKDGEEFNPGSDPELKVSEHTGSYVFYTLSNTMDTLKQYQGKYVCYASNELGTAVSNEAILSTDGNSMLITNYS